MTTQIIREHNIILDGIVTIAQQYPHASEFVVVSEGNASFQKVRADFLQGDGGLLTNVSVSNTTVASFPPIFSDGNLTISQSSSAIHLGLAPDIMVSNVVHANSLRGLLDAGLYLTNVAPSTQYHFSNGVQSNVDGNGVIHVSLSTPLTLSGATTNMIETSHEGGHSHELLTTTSRNVTDGNILLLAPALTDHIASTDHDARYYTKTDVDELIETAFPNLILLDSNVVGGANAITGTLAIGLAPNVITSGEFRGNLDASLFLQNTFPIVSQHIRMPSQLVTIDTVSDMITIDVPEDLMVDSSITVPVLYGNLDASLFLQNTFPIVSQHITTPTQLVTIDTVSDMITIDVPEDLMVDGSITAPVLYGNVDAGRYLTNLLPTLDALVTTDGVILADLTTVPGSLHVSLASNLFYTKPEVDALVSSISITNGNGSILSFGNGLHTNILDESNVLIELSTPLTLSANSQNQVTLSGHSHSLLTTRSRQEKDANVLLVAPALMDHIESEDHNALYYTKTEINTAITTQFVHAQSISGDGYAIGNLSASNVTSGTLSCSVFPADLPLEGSLGVGGNIIIRGTLFCDTIKTLGPGLPYIPLCADNGGNTTTRSQQTETILANVVYATNSLSVGTSLSYAPVHIGSTSTLENLGNLAYILPDLEGISTGIRDFGSIDVSLYCEGAVLSSMFAGISDRRVKHNISNVNTDMLEDRVMRLQPTTFSFKDHLQHGQGERLGLLAQDVQTVFPECVRITEGFLPNIWKCGTFIPHPTHPTIQIPACGSQAALQTLQSVILENEKHLHPTTMLKIVFPTQTLILPVASVDPATGCIQLDIQNENYHETIMKSEEECAVFIYGTKTTDLLSIEYDALTVACIGAAQSLHHKVAAMNQTIMSMQETLAFLTREVRERRV
jgi:hypothetical protein